MKTAQHRLFTAVHHLASAREMIEQMGYHRRDGEVKELEGKLAAPA